MGDFQSRERPVYRLEAHFQARRGFEHASMLDQRSVGMLDPAAEAAVVHAPPEACRDARSV